MRSADLFRLILLAAIWGASFLFMRIVAPALGPLWTAEVRVAVAGAAMLLFILARGKSMHFGTSWRQYLILGTLNSALPFALFSYAALTLPAGYSAILNATSPLWGALVGAAVLGETLTARKIAGLLIGIAGVAFLVRLGPAQFSPQVLVAAGACVIAALCYGIAGAYSKKASAGIAPPQMATGSQLGAALVLLPFLPLSPVRGEVTPLVIVIALVLALLCSAVAYFIYFRLIADLGPTKALTVTFLIPLFALIWGAVFLGEAVNLNTLIGCALVVLATWLVVFQPAAAPKVAA
ncbi:MAG TPA: DMT family transporter [Noviherbaspirillum sp.]|jgi:drug/metabolite transporter (DMT)-like permease|uniref:DMT family transporter n=1 Tax=Noviherbaspirillum sp. TaxID=1926288 RepID=UPI002DDD097F|nr:DMT family transporter [Noviherbaspirillum sp.]HEV2611135.1 DMT family transporter [Noviherbaspirillum sp.]